MKIAISGATGYLGSKVSESLRRAGHEVFALSRRTGRPAADAIPFDLAGGIPVPAEFSSRGIDALIHCAYSFASREVEDSQRVNVGGSAALFESAAAGGVSRIVNVSTMSAYAGCRSVYGRSKLAIEAAAERAGGISVRPGLIFGDLPGGMMGTLEKVVGASRVVPVISASGSKLHLILDEDLAGIISRLALKTPELPAGILTCAHPSALALQEILEIIASRKGVSRAFVPVPWRLAWLGLRSLEVLHLAGSLRSDSVIGLAFSDPDPNIRPDVLEELLGRALKTFRSWCLAHA